MTSSPQQRMLLRIAGKTISTLVDTLAALTMPLNLEHPEQKEFHDKMTKLYNTVIEAAKEAGFSVVKEGV